MKGSRETKPPSNRPDAGRSQPAKARPGHLKPDTFSRFVRNLARLESGPPQGGKDGEGGR